LAPLREGLGWPLIFGVKKEAIFGLFNWKIGFLKGFPNQFNFLIGEGFQKGKA